MSVHGALEHKREQRMRKSNNKPSLIPPWCHSQIEHRLEKQRQLQRHGARRSMQGNINRKPEQVDMYGRVRGKAQRLLSNGQVMPTEINMDPMGPYAYDREDMHRYEPTDLRVGTPMRAVARKTDPTRPMLNSSGYIMNQLVDHPYFLDVNGDFALPQEAPRKTHTQPMNILKIGPAKVRPPAIKPEEAWGIDKQMNSKRRQSRSYWQQTSWPGCMYQDKAKAKAALAQTQQ